jgi:hypothetical protein
MNSSHIICLHDVWFELKNRFKTIPYPTRGTRKAEDTQSTNCRARAAKGSQGAQLTDIKHEAVRRKVTNGWDGMESHCDSFGNVC